MNIAVNSVEQESLLSNSMQEFLKTSRSGDINKFAKICDLKLDAAKKILKGDKIPSTSTLNNILSYKSYDETKKSAAVKLEIAKAVTNYIRNFDVKFQSTYEKSKKSIYYSFIQ